MIVRRQKNYSFFDKIKNIFSSNKSQKEIADSPATSTNKLPIKTDYITFKEAYERMMASNYTKPHSRYCVLRKQMGPIITNPQFIFGNAERQIYVDAVTGKVTDLNPSYKEVYTRIIGKIQDSWPFKQ